MHSRTHRSLIPFLSAAAILLGSCSADAAAPIKDAKLSGASAVTGGTFTIQTGVTATAAAGSTVNLSAGTLTLATGQVGWDKVSKTSSSLADLATRSAADLSSGLLAIARGGLGIGTTPGNGKLPIGTTAGGYAIANLTAGSNVTITNGDGTITIAASTPATDFLALTDTPNAYTGEGGKLVRVNAGATALEFVSPSAGGVTDFTDLGDVPSTYTGQAGKAVKVKGDETGLEFGVASGGGSGSMAVILDEKAQGTEPADTTAGSWNTRDINTEAHDPDGIVSISGNQFTLGAGTYRICAETLSIYAIASKLRLWNVTASTTVDYSLNGGSPTGTHHNYATLTIETRVVLSGTTTMEVQHYVSHVFNSAGLRVQGRPHNLSGITERYLRVVIIKE